jgi:hypothetical protein
VANGLANISHIAHICFFGQGGSYGWPETGWMGHAYQVQLLLFSMYILLSGTYHHCSETFAQTPCVHGRQNGTSVGERLLPRPCRGA